MVDEGLQAFNVESFYANEATNAGGPRRADRRAPVDGAHAADDGAAARRRRPRGRAAAVAEAREGRRRRRAPALDAGSGRKKRARAPISPVEELEAYIEKPEPMTTLVFVAGPLDANRRLVKLLRKHADVVDCGSLESPQEAAQLDQEAPREGRADDRRQGASRCCSKPPASAWGGFAPRSRSWCSTRRGSRRSPSATCATW